MVVTVEGIITSVEKKEKDGKVFTELLLAQKGEQNQVKVRLDGDQAQHYSEFERNSFMGRLMSWRTRDGVGMMVLA